MHALEKEMATHSSILFWRIQGMEEPGGLLSMGFHRVGYDCCDLAAAAGASQAMKIWVHIKSVKKKTVKELPTNVHRSTVYHSQDMEAA